jgi:hypothetical protein
MKKLGIGISDFKKLREGGYVYVDKTEYIYRLIKEGRILFFKSSKAFWKIIIAINNKSIYLKGKENYLKDYI